MRLLLFLLFPLCAFAQPSWVNVTILSDLYSGETTWEIYNGPQAVAQSSIPYQSNNLSNEMVYLPSGDYEFVIYDAFGDGICCEFGEGWFALSNTCGVDTAVFDFNSDQLTIPFVLEPCEPLIPGCMDESANNYNPWASVDNGSCNVSECPDGEAFVSMELTLDNWPNETGFTLVDLAVGQFYEQVLPGQFNFGDQLATYTYDFCVALGFELILTDTYGDGLNGSMSGGSDGGVVITACGDEVVWELEDLAYSDNDGMVHYSGAVFVEPCEADSVIVGCMDDDYVDYNPEATDPADCLTLHTWGCMDSTSFNYDVNATISDLNSPCVTTITLEDDAGDGWGNSHVGVKQGDLQWIFTVGPGEFSQSWDLILDSDEEVDVYYFEIGGPQQPPQETQFQTLHNSIIITNEAGDTLMVEGDNPFFDNGQGALQPFSNPEWNIYHFVPYCGNSCLPYVYGCLDIEAQNYSEEANADDGSCYYAAGCTQPGYLEYYNQGYEADFDDGSCEIMAVFGCMDVTALNYDPEANVDIGTCIEAVVDCMDPNAFNYNELANISNEDACLYDAGCITGPGNPYWLNDGCYAWIIDVDPYCCDVAWDEACAELYAYCEQGWPQNIEEPTRYIDAYPNPTSSLLNISAPIGSVTTVYNSLGQIVINETRETILDFTALPKGVYNVLIRYEHIVVNKSIISQ
tara:strand:- start:11169 stop:13232 length:2064 start_codon:yes stop_codon:yes gene_type:complete